MLAPILCHLAPSHVAAVHNLVTPAFKTQADTPPPVPPPRPVAPATVATLPRQQLQPLLRRPPAAGANTRPDEALQELNGEPVSLGAIQVLTKDHVDGHQVCHDRTAPFLCTTVRIPKMLTIILFAAPALRLRRRLRLLDPIALPPPSALPHPHQRAAVPVHAFRLRIRCALPLPRGVFMLSYLFELF